MIKDKLIKEVEALIAETDKTHRYSMSKIYGTYNKVFGKNETPQTCASCLIRKTKELKEWLNENWSPTDGVVQLDIPQEETSNTPLRVDKPKKKIQTFKEKEI